jgi:hypothetical protein
MRPISGAWIVVCFTSACLSGFTADEAASSSSPPPNDRSATPVGGGDDRMATASEGDMPSAVPFTDEQDEETPPVMPADSLDAPRPPIELTDIDQAMRVVTWGSTALTYEYHPGNLRLLANVLAAFSGGSPVERRGRFLYTSGCDPRQDADYCGAESFVEVKPFLDAVGLVGTIEFRPAGAVQVGDYAGIIVDACEPNAWDWVSASDSATSIRRTPPPRGERCHGAAAGVESMRVLRYTPQSIASSVDAGLVTANGIVIARDVH